MTEKERQEQGRKAGLAGAAKRWGLKGPKQPQGSGGPGRGRFGPRTEVEREAQAEKMRSYWAKKKAEGKGPDGP